MRELGDGEAWPPEEILAPGNYLTASLLCGESDIEVSLCDTMVFVRATATTENLLIIVKLR